MGLVMGREAMSHIQPAEREAVTLDQKEAYPLLPTTHMALYGGRWPLTTLR